MLFTARSSKQIHIISDLASMISLPKQINYQIYYSMMFTITAEGNVPRVSPAVGDGSQPARSVLLLCRGLHRRPAPSIRRRGTSPTERTKPLALSLLV